MGMGGGLPPIDLPKATTIFTPDESGEGNWAGAPCALNHHGTTYLAVRFRNPTDRGHILRFYEQVGATTYTERTTITAADLDVVSIERPALLTDPGSKNLKLYLSVDHGENDWTIQKIDDAPTPAAFDPSTARDVLTPQPGTTDEATVKDPYIVLTEGVYYMFYAGHDGQSEQAHAATSTDGIAWERVPNNPVLPRQHWHDHHTRVSCIVPVPDTQSWLVFYEGSGTGDYKKTWNLRTGIGVSSDLESVVDSSPKEPYLAAPIAAQRRRTDQFVTCRYIDVLQHETEWEVFLEVAREDGTFDLRRTTVDSPPPADG